MLLEVSLQNSTCYIIEAHTGLLPRWNMKKEEVELAAKTRPTTQSILNVASVRIGEGTRGGKGECGKSALARAGSDASGIDSLDSMLDAGKRLSPRIVDHVHLAGTDTPRTAEQQDPRKNREAHLLFRRTTSSVGHARSDHHPRSQQIQKVVLTTQASAMEGVGARRSG